VGEGRRLTGDGLDDAYPAGGETLHEVGERGQVVVLLEALARRLHADGEVPELAGGAEQAVHAEVFFAPARAPMSTQGVRLES